MSAVATYEKLVEKGCLCGTDRPQDCPLHKSGDLRGLGAFFRAGMPLGFPMEATCAICKAPSLLYPDIEQDKPTDDGPVKHRPTLVCPRCSTPAAERSLRAEVEGSGLHQLNSRTVFGAVAA